MFECTFTVYLDTFIFYCCIANVHCSFISLYINHLLHELQRFFIPFHCESHSVGIKISEKCQKSTKAVVRTIEHHLNARRGPQALQAPRKKKKHQSVGVARNSESRNPAPLKSQDQSAPASPRARHTISCSAHTHLARTCAWLSKLVRRARALDIPRTRDNWILGIFHGNCPAAALPPRTSLSRFFTSVGWIFLRRRPAKLRDFSARAGFQLRNPASFAFPVNEGCKEKTMGLLRRCSRREFEKGASNLGIGAVYARLTLQAYDYWLLSGAMFEDFQMELGWNFILGRCLLDGWRARANLSMFSGSSV